MHSGWWLSDAARGAAAVIGALSVTSWIAVALALLCMGLIYALVWTLDRIDGLRDCNARLWNERAELQRRNAALASSNLRMAELVSRPGPLPVRLEVEGGVYRPCLVGVDTAGN